MHTSIHFHVLPFSSFVSQKMNIEPKSPHSPHKITLFTISLLMKHFLITLLSFLFILFIFIFSQFLYIFSAFFFSCFLSFFFFFLTFNHFSSLYSLFALIPLVYFLLFSHLKSLPQSQ